ncbi:phage holin, lambda family [Pantoea brenneri]|uniref:phage holin, lambda family n=1 Tax=Pantoea brenneri TaxID=472694 RepID=UPI0024487587|nr:phage holin, lambda family [Pantoea brenneri]MDH1086336.1 phage holin, lambda family [Pantoea brenneri]
MQAFLFQILVRLEEKRVQNNPNNWPGMYELVQSWWRGETPVGAILLAMFMAVLRIAYTGGGWRRMILEGLLCGALTLTVASALAYFDWPRTATIAIGGSVGFIGVDSLRTFVLRFIGNRIGVKDDSERGPGHTK